MCTKSIIVRIYDWRIKTIYKHVIANKTLTSCCDRVCIDKSAEGVSISNCKYPLCDAVLWRERQYAVSNEFIGCPAEIEVKRGALFVVESNN